MSNWTLINLSPFCNKATQPIYAWYATLHCCIHRDLSCMWNLLLGSISARHMASQAKLGQGNGFVACSLGLQAWLPSDCSEGHDVQYALPSGPNNAAKPSFTPTTLVPSLRYGSPTCPKSHSNTWDKGSCFLFQPCFTFHLKKSASRIGSEAFGLAAHCLIHVLHNLFLYEIIQGEHLTRNHFAV